jgi:UPF0042 nucleotide-binding protein
MGAVTDVLVITGLSGAGRSQAADDLEDLGWFVVDNLPLELLDKIVELGSGPAVLALGSSSGPNASPTELLAAIARLREAHRVIVLFLDASTPELVAATAAPAQAPARRRHVGHGGHRRARARAARAGQGGGGLWSSTRRS